jgi:hypothetical protein
MSGRRTMIDYLSRSEHEVLKSYRRALRHQRRIGERRRHSEPYEFLTQREVSYRAFDLLIGKPIATTEERAEHIGPVAFAQLFASGQFARNAMYCLPLAFRGVVAYPSITRIWWAATYPWLLVRSSERVRSAWQKASLTAFRPLRSRKPIWLCSWDQR